MVSPFRERRLLRKLRRGSRTARLVAAREIGHGGSLSLMDKLLRMAELSEGGVAEGPYVASRLILGRFPVPELCRRLTDRRLPVAVRVAMLEEVRMRGERRAAKLLLPVMIGAEREISFRASQVMGSVGDGTVVPALARALAQQEPQAREAAALSLGLIGSSKAVTSLVRLLGDSERRVAYTACLAIGLIARESGTRSREIWYEEVGGREPLNWLIDCTRAKEPALRAMGCFALGEVAVDRETVVEAVKECLKDADLTVRQWAACACGRLGARTAVEKLMGLMKDDRSAVRGAAAQAVGALEDRRAIPGMLQLLTDRNARVRTKAEDALEHMTYHLYERPAKKPPPSVMHWRQWWSQNGKATRDVWLKQRVVKEIEALESPKLYRRKRAIEFLQSKTKQRHEYQADGPRTHRLEGIRTWKAWWHRSRQKHPVEWLIDGLRSADEHRRQAAYLDLKRVTKGMFVYDAYATISRRSEALRNIEAWWDKNKKLFIDADSPL